MNMVEGTKYPHDEVDRGEKKGFWKRQVRWLLRLGEREVQLDLRIDEEEI